MSVRAFRQPVRAPRFVLKELAVAAMLFTAAVPVAVAQAADPAAASEQLRRFDLAPGPLAETLNRFVAETGLFVSADGALTQGKTSAAVRGSFTPAQALAQLLAGTGLQAVAQGDGAYALAPLKVDASGATLMQAVKVQANAERNATSEGSGSYAPGPSKTATGLSLSPRDTPQSVTVITRERIDDQQMKTVADALRNTTGVSLKATDRGRNALSVRGFDVTNFQLDGVPITTGNVGAETASTVIYDRVEVVRGATGLLSGAGDPSAAINLVRKHADSKTFTGSASAQLGSWDRRTLTADVTTPLNAAGSIRARVAGSYSEQDAFIDIEHTENTTFYAVVDADLSERTRLSVGASDQRDDRDGVYWGGLPYWFEDGSRTNWSRSTTTAADWNVWDTRERTVFATLEHGFENRWTLRVHANHYRQKEYSNLLWVTGEPKRTTGEGMDAYPYLYLTKPRQNQFSALASGPFSLFGREHELLAGLIYSRVKGGWDNGGVPLNEADYLNGIGNFYEWNGSFVKPDWDPAYVASRATITQSAAYAAARLQLADPLKLIAGARVSRYQQENEQAAWTAEAYELKESSVLTPYLGVLYDIGRHFTAYAGYTTIFNPQNNRDRNGNYLDPLEGNSYEAGLKGEFLDGQLNASAAVFRIEQDNFAVEDVGYTIPGTSTAASRAAKGVETEGYELEVVGQLSLQWDVSLGWTSYSARDAQDMNVAVIHPRRLLKAFTKYEFTGALSRLSAGAGVDWQGDVPERRANPASGVSEKIGQRDFAIVELMAKYQLIEPLSVQLNVYNALDKKYYEGSWGTFTYGEPRRVLLSLDYQF